jgi:hypothetical protein
MGRAHGRITRTGRDFNVRCCRALVRTACRRGGGRPRLGSTQHESRSRRLNVRPIVVLAGRATHVPDRAGDQRYPPVSHGHSAGDLRRITKVSGTANAEIAIHEWNVSVSPRFRDRRTARWPAGPVSGRGRPERRRRPQPGGLVPQGSRSHGRAGGELVRAPSTLADKDDAAGINLPWSPLRSCEPCWSGAGPACSDGRGHSSKPVTSTIHRRRSAARTV